MRKNITALLVVLLAAAPAILAQGAPKPGSREFFADLTERRAAAYIAGDRAFYERLLSAEFVLVGDNGVVTKKNPYLDAEFASKHSEGMKPFYAISDFEVITQRKDFAIVSYVKTEGMEIGEQTFSADARRLDTYALEAGQWRLVAMVASRILKPPKPIAIAAGKLADYAGKYSVSPGVSSVITAADGHLAEQTTGQPPTKLVPVGPDTFFDPGDSPTARTTFRRDATGKVVSWVYSNGDQEVVAGKLAPDK